MSPPHARRRLRSASLGARSATVADRAPHSLLLHTPRNMLIRASYAPPVSMRSSSSHSVSTALSHASRRSSTSELSTSSTSPSLRRSTIFELRDARRREGGRVARVRGGGGGGGACVRVRRAARPKVGLVLVLRLPDRPLLRGRESARRSRYRRRRCLEPGRELHVRRPPRNHGREARALRARFACNKRRQGVRKNVLFTRFFLYFLRFFVIFQKNHKKN